MTDILITGVAGLIGSHLLDRALVSFPYSNIVGIDNLSFGSTKNVAHVMANRRFSFIKGDACNRHFLDSLGKFDYIFHMAAVKKIWEKHSSTLVMKSNCDGTRNIVEFCNSMNAKLIFASTSDVYGLSMKLPFSEDGPLTIGPSHIKRWSYALSKIYGEQLIFSYIAEYGLKSVILRYFGTYGPRMSSEWSGGPISLFFQSIKKGRPIQIHGNGLQTRSFIYVSDVVDATLKSAVTPEAIGKIINVGTEEEVTILELAKMCSRVANKTLNLEFVPMASVFGSYQEINRRVPDITKFRSLLRLNPKYDLMTGLQMTYDRL